MANFSASSFELFRFAAIIVLVTGYHADMLEKTEVFKICGNGNMNLIIPIQHDS
jgi:hypothetical protein